MVRRNLINVFYNETAATTFAIYETNITAKYNKDLPWLEATIQNLVVLLFQ